MATVQHIIVKSKNHGSICESLSLIRESDRIATEGMIHRPKRYQCMILLLDEAQC